MLSRHSLACLEFISISLLVCSNFCMANPAPARMMKTSSSCGFAFEFMEWLLYNGDAAKLSNRGGPRMSAPTLHEFQQQVSELLLRHRSLLDVVTKFSQAG